jgi:protein-S-isoprenylcysteine O-methyltransferase Ste14
MALAGLGQGAAVGLWLGSWGVLAYVAAGGVLWHAAVRPAEERDLARRFGAAYAAYRAAVPLWRPRLRAYRATPPSVRHRAPARR